ncbi:MAG TPA: hypothetical protein ENI94_06020 [Gammaproteobacteria bacterium]|nr:hypothetical protein [Gammaproteobacteria bacterium]
MSSRLIVNSHSLWLRRARLALILVALGLGGWGVFLLGQQAAGLDNDSLRAERDRLRAQLSEAETSNRRLSARVAVLERAEQIDRQAYGEVERSLRQVQDEMLELKEEVAFYRGIVSPAETASGLNVTRFSLFGMGGEGVYRFKLVLTQLRTNNRLVKGHARITIEGVLHGKQTQLSLKEVSGGTLDRLKLRFKYFQNIEGDIVLPEGFLPSRVIVEVVPVGKGWQHFKKSFDWSDIIA